MAWLDRFIVEMQEIHKKMQTNKTPIFWTRKKFNPEIKYNCLLKITGKVKLQTFVTFLQKPQPRKIPAVGFCEVLCRHKTSKAVLWIKSESHTCMCSVQSLWVLQTILAAYLPMRSSPL